MALTWRGDRVVAANSPLSLLADASCCETLGYDQPTLRDGRLAYRLENPALKRWAAINGRYGTVAVFGPM